VWFLDPEVNDNTTSFSDLTFGAKSILVSNNDFFGVPTPRISSDRFMVSSLLNTHISLGSALTHRGLVTGHVSLEPGVLASYELTPRTYFHGSASYWIPLGGSSFASNVFQCGVGVSHVLLSTALSACPNDSFAVLPTFEVVSHTFTSGLQTLPDGTVTAADSDPIINLQPGVRTVIGNHFEAGSSFDFNVTEPHLYRHLARFEIRWFW
jgi:hypothetical protein